MGLIAGILVAVALGFAFSDDFKDVGDFLTTFFMALAMVALAYIGLSLMAQ